MNLQPVDLRPGQRLQCARCHSMAPSHAENVLADLDAPPFTFYHAHCAAEIRRCPVYDECFYGCRSASDCVIRTHGVQAAEMSRTILLAGSPWPFPDGPVKPRRVKHGPPADAEDALL